MSRTGRILVAAIALVAALAFVAWHRRWFASEPVYHGRTVTEWLDSMRLFAEVRADDTPENGGFIQPASADELLQDPALRAILALGSNAVPILRLRLLEAPAYSVSAKLDDQLSWQVDKLTSRDPISAPTPPTALSGLEFARKHAAALAWLALDTDQGGGLESFAAAVASDFNYLEDLAWTPGVALHLARQFLPEPVTRIDEPLTRLLTGTNVELQRFAAQATLMLGEPSPGWRTPLLQLADPDADPRVRQTALVTLTMRLPQDPDVMALCGRILEINVSMSLHWFAAAGLRRAGPAASNYVPVLRSTLAQTNAQLQRIVTEAIRSIESGPSPP